MRRASTEMQLMHNVLCCRGVLSTSKHSKQHQIPSTFQAFQATPNSKHIPSIPSNIDFQANSKQSKQPRILSNPSTVQVGHFVSHLLFQLVLNHDGEPRPHVHPPCFDASDACCPLRVRRFHLVALASLALLGFAIAVADFAAHLVALVMR